MTYPTTRGDLTLAFLLPGDRRQAAVRRRGRRASRLTKTGIVKPRRSKGHPRHYGAALFKLLARDPGRGSKGGSSEIVEPIR